MGTKHCYKLTGVVIFQGHPAGDSGHCTCYFKDQYQNQWFYANDSHVSVIILSSKYIIPFIYMQVSPVSTTTVLQKDPFLLIYELQGTASV